MKKTYKNNLRRIICVLLSIIMLSSLCSVMAAGEGIRRYENYVCIGDSVAAGSRLGHPYGRGQFVEGSYAKIIRDSIADDPENCVNLARSGYRIREFLMVLDGSVPGDNLTYTYMPSRHWGGVSIEDMLAQRDHFVTSIENANLITIELGSNSILLRLYDLYLRKLKDIFSLDELVTTQIDEAADNEDTTQSLINLISLAQKLGVYTDMLSNGITVIEQGIAEFALHWNLLLGKIYALNPDAEIVAVSMYNPMNSYINDSQNEVIARLLHGVLEGAFSRMNAIIQYANPYSCRYKYADITALFIGESNDGLHPDAAGHSCIANQIFAALPKTIPAPTVIPIPNMGRITLSWNGVESAESYKLYRAVFPYKNFTEIAEVTDTSYTDNTAAVRISYAYKVRAVDVGGNMGELSLPVFHMRSSILEAFSNIRRFR